MISRRFARFWAGSTISQFGDRISELALPLIAVVTLSATPTEVGLLTAAIWTPNLLSLLVGSWVDRRTHRKRLLIIADIVRAAILLSLPLAHWFGVVTLGQLFVVAALGGGGQVLFSAAYQSFYVSLVDRDRYVDANSKLSISSSASQIAGPAIGGFLIQVLTAPVAVLIDAVSFVCSAFVISSIETEPAPVEKASSSLLADARAGLRYVLAHPYLRASLACVTTVNFFTFMAQALVVLFATRALGLSSGMIGLAFGIGALGGLGGALIAPRLSIRYGTGRMICVGAVLFPAPIGVAAFAGGSPWRVLIVVSAVQAASAAGVMFLDINLNALQTTVTADHMRSRMVGVFGTINYGIRPLGAVVGGFLGSAVGLRPTLLIAAVGGAMCCLWLLWSPIPRVRALSDLGDNGGRSPAAVATPSLR
jgi:MFS family permease